MTDIFLPTEIVLVGVDELLPFANNTRKHSPEQIELLAAVIKQAGWTNPCLIADGGILAGHGRIMAAKKLGLSKVPCIDLSHLSEVERRALVIQDNRLAEFGTTWDLEMLRLETDYLRDEGFDLDLTGFDEDTLAELLGEAELPDDSDKDPDETPALPDEPVSVPGDVWILGAHKVVCGDSTDLNVWDRLLEGERADVVFTDPPFNVDLGRKNRLMDKAVGGNRDANGSIANDKMSADDFAELLAGAFGSLYANMKPGAVIYYAHADKVADVFRAEIDKAGFHFSQMLIWNKGQHVLGMADFQPSHEPIGYAWKKGSKHRWYGGRKQKTVIEIGAGGPITQLDDGRWAVKVGDQVLIVSGEATIEESPSTVLFEPKPAASGLHPSTKPVALIERLLGNSARPGDIVLDAFGGSGSTLIAADRLGMCARLCEVEPRYVDVICRRYWAYSGRRPVNAATGEPFPAEGDERDATFASAASIDQSDDMF